MEKTTKTYSDGEEKTVHVCEKCGWQEFSSSDVQIHENYDCKGYKKPRKCFAVEDEVVLSRLGKSWLGSKYDKGVVTGFDDGPDHCVVVDWVDRGKSSITAVFLENLTREPPVSKEVHAVKEL